MTVLPKLVALLVNCCNAWVIGSAAKVGVDTLILRDWDVVIPLTNWPTAAPWLPKDARPNTFGGWKCKDGETTIDVWPDDLARLLCMEKAKYIWHPASGNRWVKQ